MPQKTKKTGSSPHLIVSKPITILNRDIDANLGGLFKALGKSIVHLGTGKTWELAADGAEVVASLGLKTDPGGLAWYLIHRSLLRAMQTLADEAWLRRTEEQPTPSEELENQLDREVNKTTLEVSENFFRQPGQLPFIDACSAWFNLWLIRVGFDKPKALSISQRLRTYFVYALNQEWRIHPDLYAPIITAKDTPFIQAGERERAWEQYAAWLDQELDGAMFGEPFSLRQLYIPLRAYYTRIPNKTNDGLISKDSSKNEKRIAIDFTKHTLEWISRQDKEDAFRVVSGGPGSGKSSVARMFTAEVLAKTSWKALYIPLHRIQYKGEIVAAIDDYLRRTSLLPGNPHPLDQSTGDPQLLLVFDGLDELAMLGKLAQETASQFVRAIKDYVRDRNTTSLRLKVILTGRTMIMQSLETEFRREGTLLHLCPYYVEESEKKRYERGWDLIENDDQRQLWWKTYGRLTGRKYKGLPDHFDRSDLVEVSSEPLLNYLLALADQTDTLDFSKSVTQNQIYSSLVHELYDRRWADGENFAVKGMTEDHFHRVLEEIAVAAWHGDGRKTTVGEIKQHCQDAGIMRMLETFQEGAENGVLRLLTAFFFRQAGVRDDENAFEFTHKSFGEYLVARRLLRMIDIMDRKAEEQKSEFTGWDERKCLEEWARLCGASALTERQTEFLQNEMQANLQITSKWQDLLVALINVSLRQGLPMEKIELTDFQTMRLYSRNAEETLIVMLNSCARVTKQVSQLIWPDLMSAGAWIKQLQGQRHGPSNSLALSSLSYLNFDGQCLDISDCYNADMTCSSFREARGQSICLWQAHLANTCLEGIHFTEANLRSADIRQANLRGALLHDADLREANLQNSDLEEADLEGADLQGTDLKGANLQNANLRNADLRGADLRGANFKQARIGGALIDSVILNGGELDDADHDVSNSAKREPNLPPRSRLRQSLRRDKRP